MNETKTKLSVHPMIGVTTDPKYRETALWLESHGYKPQMLAPDEGGLVPLVFVGKSTLFLKRAERSRYDIVEGDHVSPLRGRTVTLPAGNTGKYVWIPVEYGDKPSLYSPRDVSEFIGVAMSTIKRAIWGQDSTLIPDEQVGEKKHAVFHEQTVVRWYLSRLGQEGRPVERAQTEEYLAMVGTDRLGKTLLKKMACGEISPHAVRQALAATGAYLPPVWDIAQLASRAQEHLDRASLIQLVAE